MKIEKRTESLKHVREMNKVPGVLFGKTIEPESIQIDEKDLRELYRQYGLTQTFEVKMGRKKHLVYIKEVQNHILNQNQFLNVKLLKVTEGDTIKADLPIILVGKETIEKPGVIVQLLTDSVEVEYAVGHGLSHIDLDVTGMEVGDSKTIGDLSIPEGLTVMDDLDKLVVNVSETKYISEDEEETEAEDIDPMDVEVITEKTEE